MERFLDSAQHLLRADLDLATSKARRVAIREEHVARMKKCMEINWDRYKAGRASITDHSDSRYFYFDACIELEREKLR
jgi:hypothetical protein